MQDKIVTFNIIARLCARDMKKEDLCEAIGIKKRTLYLVLSGRQKYSIELMGKICAYFECTMEELMESIPEQYL